MENKLGKHEETIKPNVGKYFLECAICMIAIIAVILFRDFYEGKAVYGLPVVPVILVLAPLILIGSIVRIVIAIANKTNIELYEQGIVVGDFSARYQEVTFQKRKGPFKINDSYIFDDGERTKEFKFSISTKDHAYIVEKLNNTRETKPVVAVPKEGMDSLFPLAKELAKPVNIKIIREKAYIGSGVDYALYLNEEPIGGIMNDATRVVVTHHSRNMITFSNNDGIKNIYFDITENESPVIVIKTNSFQLEKCTGCKLLSEEEAYATR